MSEAFGAWLASEITKAETVLARAEQGIGRAGLTTDWCRGNQSALNAAKSAYNALKTASDETRVDL